MKGKAFGHRSSNIKGDLFQTHYPLTIKLLEKETFPGTILDPCSGHGAITRVLKNKYPGMVDSFDLYYGKKRQDFFNYFGLYNNIVSNCPYGDITDNFVIHAKKQADKVAFLLRTNYLSGQARHDSTVYDELKHIYVFNRMPDLKAPIRGDGKFPTAMIVYAWFVWEKGWRMEPTVRKLDISEYVLRKGKRRNK